MTNQDDRVCPVALAGGLDNRIRRWLQSPRRILAPYVREGMTAVDLGCGPGFFTVELADLVGPSGHVIAVDLQPGMLEKVRRNIQGTPFAGRVTLHQAQADTMGLSARADFALAFYMLHEVPNQASFLEEVRQLLAPAGHLLIVEPPLHVSRKAFEQTLDTAARVGFEIAARPGIAFSKCVLLRAGGASAAPA